MFEKGLGVKFLCVVEIVLTALYPVKPRGVPGVRVRVRVREKCKHHHFCKCGRTVGQGALDGSKDRARDFRFYGSLKGGGECNNMLHCYTDTHPGNYCTFLVFLC